MHTQVVDEDVPLVLEYVEGLTHVVEDGLNRDQRLVQLPHQFL